MVFINQTARFDWEKLEKQLKLLSKYTYKLNISEIKGKIKKLDYLKNKANQKSLKLGIEKVIRYLQKLLLTVGEDGSIMPAWHLNGDAIVSDPIKTREFRYLGISYSEFIELKTNVTILRYDLQKLLNLIFFEMSYRDWGYTQKELEDSLENYGFIGVHSPEVLENMLDTTYMYERTAPLIIEDSPYYDRETKEVFDYFGENLGKQKTYKSMLESTRNKVFDLVLSKILTCAKQSKLKGLKLLSVTDTELCLLINNSAGSSVNDLLDMEFQVFLFGRRFVVDKVISKIEVDSLNMEKK